MAPLPYSVVDAFTSKAFKGNAAAVIVLKSPLHTTLLQDIATEFNLSETAFITPIDASKGLFGLRWFTPSTEVALCGHATLAAALVLFSDESVLPSSVKKIEFKTNVSGTLIAKLSSNGRIELEFPAGETIPVSNEKQATVRTLMKEAFASSLNPEPSVANIVSGVGNSYSDYLIIEIDEDFDLRGATVNADALGTLAPESRVMIVTQSSKNGNETFKSRVFAPAVGIPEDPVTGSAHSLLGPYWAARLDFDNEGNKEMLGRQVSKREGEIWINLDKKSNTAKLKGNAVIVHKGVLLLPD